jgi:hypothetical protein
LNGTKSGGDGIKRRNNFSTRFFYLISVNKPKEEQQHAEFSNCCCSLEPFNA